MNKNFGTLIVIITVINIFIACFIAFYLTSKSSSLLENQKVIPIRLKIFLLKMGI